MTQEGRGTTSKAKKIEKRVSAPVFSLSGGAKIIGKHSRSDLIDKHSPGRGTSEGPRSILKRTRRITVATQLVSQGKAGSGFVGEKQSKAKPAPQPRKSISPDLLDLTNEDVVRDVVLRLYDSLGIADDQVRIR